MTFLHLTRIDGTRHILSYADGQEWPAMQELGEMALTGVITWCEARRAMIAVTTDYLWRLAGLKVMK